MVFQRNALAASASTVVAVLAAVVARTWDFRENVFFNVSALFQPVVLVSMDGVLGTESTEEQLAILTKSRAAWELAAVSSTSVDSAAFRYFYGNDIANALFGPNATRVVEFSVPSSSSSSSLSSRTIAVACACPHDASSSSPPLPLVLFFHSGGLITGSVASELHLARYVAYKSDSVVCSVEYRLAPEHPYPAAIEDGVDAALALLRPPPSNEDRGVGEGTEKKNNNPAAQALGVNVDPSAFGTFGSSAGGYLSASVARTLAFRYNATAAVQVSLVPMAKPNGGTRSLVKNWYDPFWSGALNSYAWSVFLRDDEDGSLASDWRVSLLMENDGDDGGSSPVDRLPPVYVQINTRDGLRDEGAMYAERLRKQGKLIGLDECDATHVGSTPPFQRRTPHEGAYDRAISVLASRLNAAAAR